MVSLYMRFISKIIAKKNYLFGKTHFRSANFRRTLKLNFKEEKPVYPLALLTQFLQI